MVCQKLPSHVRILGEEGLMSEERLETVAFTPPPFTGEGKDGCSHLHRQAQDAHRSKCAHEGKAS